MSIDRFVGDSLLFHDKDGGTSGIEGTSSDTKASKNTIDDCKQRLQALLGNSPVSTDRLFAETSGQTQTDTGWPTDERTDTN